MSASAWISSTPVFCNPGTRTLTELDGKRIDFRIGCMTTVTMRCMEEKGKISIEIKGLPASYGTAGPKYLTQEGYDNLKKLVCPPEVAEFKLAREDY